MYSDFKNKRVIWAFFSKQMIEVEGFLLLVTIHTNFT